MTFSICTSFVLKTGEDNTATRLAEINILTSWTNSKNCISYTVVINWSLFKTQFGIIGYASDLLFIVIILFGQKY